MENTAKDVLISTVRESRLLVKEAGNQFLLLYSMRIGRE